MMSRVLAELERTPVPGPWIAAARTLATTGVITDDAVYYFVAIFLECLTFEAAGNDAEMLRLYAEMERVKRAHGLAEDEDWFVYEAPAEWQALNAAWDQRDADLRVSALRAMGHDDIAALLERDPEDFRRREASGYYDVWGEDDA